MFPVRRCISGESSTSLVFKSDNQKNSFEIQNQNIVLSMSAKAR